MKKRQLPLLLLAVAMSWTAQADPVTPQTAKLVADKVLATRTQPADLPADVAEVYLFVADEGFAIVAADDCVRPVIAYGSRWIAAGDTLPAAVHEWLADYCGEIAARRQNKVEASAETRAEWQQLTTGGGTPGEPLYSVVVSPMLTTTWNQSPYYNKFCPSNCVTGCVATATAQMMKYWNHPAQGTGAHSYVDGSHGTLSADFANTTYQWSLMPNALTGSTGTNRVNAVATLMFHIGVAVEMSYGSSSSATTGSYGSPTSVCAENALKTYFGYSRAMRHVIRAAMDDSLWCALIDEELAAARPILYSGRDVDGGHAFVLDGCDNAGHYHFNWGWGGYCDGYYIMGQLNPSPGGIGGSYSSTYNLKNGALMGIRPAPEAPPTSCPVSVTLTDDMHASATDAGAHQYGDTVSIKVNTQTGYRFTRWSDGVHNNPRRAVLDSALSLTAIVESIHTGDTVYYCNNYHSTSYGNGGAFIWGIKLTADELQHYTSLRAVQIYDKEEGAYELRLYQGGNASPTTLVYTQNVNLTGSASWVEIPLSTVQEVNPSYSLWVVFYNNTVSYPAAVSTYGGHKNGSMCANGSGSNWHGLNADYSFMVRAVFNQRPPCTDIDTIIYDTAVGSYTWNGNTYSQSGTYVYNGTTVEGCDSIVSLHLTINPPVGIAAGDAMSQLAVYPNPVGDWLIVEGMTPGTSVTVYDLTGREVLRHIAETQVIRMDMSALGSGVYFLRAGTELRRIVVR